MADRVTARQWSWAFIGGVVPASALERVERGLGGVERAAARGQSYVRMLRTPKVPRR